MKKILVIEDEKALVEVLRDEFTLHNFDVVVAYNGEDAMKQMRAELPDFILLDLLLPRKDGFEILQEKQKDKTIRDIPVLVLSNLGQGDDVERAITLGAVDYFIKTQHPINEIVKKVQYILSGVAKK